MRICIESFKAQWAGQRSRYSDWLRAGGSGDWIPVGGEIFLTCPERPWGPPSLLHNGYRVLPEVKSGRGVTMTHHPLLSAVVMKAQSYTSTPPMGRTACAEPQCLYKGGTLPFFLIYSEDRRQCGNTTFIVHKTGENPMSSDTLFPSKFTRPLYWY